MIWCGVNLLQCVRLFFITATALVTSYCMRGFIQSLVKLRQLKVSHELEIILHASFSVINIRLFSECAFMIFLRIIFEDIPIAMCLWWNGSHNLLQYLLLKKEKGTPATNSYIYNAKYSIFITLHGQICSCL